MLQLGYSTALCALVLSAAPSRAAVLARADAARPHERVAASSVRVDEPESRGARASGDASKPVATAPKAAADEPKAAGSTVANRLLAQSYEPLPTDTVHLADKRRISLVILDETAEQLVGKLVMLGDKRQLTGLIDMAIDKDEVARVERIGDEPRRKWKARIEAFEGRDTRRGAERARLEVVPLKVYEWFGVRVVGRNFEIRSTCKPEFVKDVLVGLDEIYGGYLAFFGAEAHEHERIVVYLLADVEQYRAFCQARYGVSVLNPAFYHVVDNTIVAYDLVQQREAAAVEAQVEAEHAKIAGYKRDLDKQKADADKRLAELRKQARDMRGLTSSQRSHLQRVLRDAERDVRAEAKRIRGHYDDAIAANRAVVEKNRGILRKQRRPLVEGLFHEGFHAFVNNFVVRRTDGVTDPLELATRMPRWLNEGIAMYFETSVLEGDELTHGGLHAASLEILARNLADGKLIPLRDLITRSETWFLVGHAKDAPRSDLAYAEAWSLVHFLVGRIGGGDLEGFLDALRAGTKPAEAIEQMLGAPLATLEQQWLEYVRRLGK